jgi:hypothetical protein
MFNDVMLKHFTFSLRKHLVFDHHEELGFLVELQLIGKLLFQVHGSLDENDNLLLIQELEEA